MTHRPKTLRLVQNKLRRWRWEPEYRDYANGRLVAKEPRRRRGTAEQRDQEAKEIREARVLLGPRWFNPLAWAAALHIHTPAQGLGMMLARKGVSG